MVCVAHLSDLPRQIQGVSALGLHSRCARESRRRCALLRPVCKSHERLSVRWGLARAQEAAGLLPSSK